MATSLAEFKEEFRKEFGEEVMQMHIFEEGAGSVVLPPPDKRKGKWDAIDANSVEDYESSGIRLLDNQLVRQIEAHLAGLPRPSEEYGPDAKYLEEKEWRQKQVFDEANYEAFLDAERLDKMTDYEKQQELLYRRKAQQVKVQK